MFQSLNKSSINSPGKNKVQKIQFQTIQEKGSATTNNISNSNTISNNNYNTINGVPTSGQNIAKVYISHQRRFKYLPQSKKYRHDLSVNLTRDTTTIQHHHPNMSFNLEECAGSSIENNFEDPFQSNSIEADDNIYNAQSNTLKQTLIKYE